MEEQQYIKFDKPQMLTFTTKDGDEIEAEILLSFRFKKEEKQYVIYTFHEKDKNDMVIIHTSIYKEDGDKFTLEKIEDPAEWARVKEVLRLAIKESRGMQE